MSCEDVSDDLFKKLGEEFFDAVQIDKRNCLQNETKLRAAGQNICYDEFRDLVNAAHLKPLDKADKKNANRPPKVWNRLAIKSSTSNEFEMPIIPTQSKTCQTKSPKNSQEFLQIWKHDCILVMDRFQLLKSANNGKLFDRLIASGTCLDIFSDVMKTLSCPEADDTENLVVAIQILTKLAKSRRFDLTIQLLSSAERSDVSKAWSQLKLRLCINQEKMADVFGITDMILEKLDEKLFGNHFYTGQT